MAGRRRDWTAGAAAVLVAALGVGCGGAPRPELGPRWDAPARRAPHPDGSFAIEYPGYLEPQAPTDRSWLHLSYKAPDAWASIVFLRDCLEPGAGAESCPGLRGCALRPGTTALLPLGRARGRLLEVLRRTYFWNTSPRLCARVSLRVATRRPEYDPLTALLREFPRRIRVVPRARPAWPAAAD